MLGSTDVVIGRAIYEHLDRNQQFTPVSCRHVISQDCEVSCGLRFSVTGCGSSEQVQ